MKQNAPTWAEVFTDIFMGILLVAALWGVGWLFTEYLPTVRPAIAAAAEVATSAATTRADAGPLVTRDQLLSSARYVVNDWREADAVMAQHTADEINAMLRSGEIIVVMPDCPDGVYMDQSRPLVRYSCDPF